MCCFFISVAGASGDVAGEYVGVLNMARAPLDNTRRFPTSEFSPAVVVSRGASYLALQTVITSIAQTVSFVVLARIITTAEMGILAVLSLVTAFCLALDGGTFQQAASKFIGELTAGQRKRIASAVFYQNLRISLLLCIPLAAVIFFYAPALSLGLLGISGDAYLFRFVAVDLLVYAGALPVAIGTLFGMQRFRASAAIGIAGVLLRQCLIILLIVFLNNFVGLVIAWILSDFATAAAYLVYVFRVIGPSRGVFSLRRLLGFSWPLSIGNVISFGYSWFDRVLLAVFVPLALLGVYNAALFAFTAMMGISSSINNALLPAYSSISSQRYKFERCRRATKLASRYVSLIIVPLAFGLMATAKPALSLLLGQAYDDGIVPLMILSCAFGLTAVATALAPMLLAISETGLVMVITLVSVLVGLGSASFLLPAFGIIGASISRGLTIVISAVLTILALDLKKAIRLDVEAIWKSLVAGTLMVIVLVGAQLVFYNKFLLPGYIFLGGITYVFMLRVMKTVKAHDVDLINKYLGAKLGFATRFLVAIAVSDQKPKLPMKENGVG